MGEHHEGQEHSAAPPRGAVEPDTGAAPPQAPPETGSDAERKLLLVALSDAVVALPAESLVEVLPARPYARLPGAPSSVVGLVNRRGRMLTVIDLGVALGEDPSSTAEEHRVVVVASGGRELGLAVKDVLQITRDWWSGADEDVDGVEVEAGEEVVGAEWTEAEDERLRVVELDTVFAPLFGGGATAAENQP